MFKKTMLIVLITITVLFFKLFVINNFFVPKIFYWDIFSNNWKNRDYRIEGETGCKIIEIGKKGKYYYGKVVSDGITLYRPGEYDYSKCEDEYFLIDSSKSLSLNLSLNGGIYYKKKEYVLNITKEYKVKEPYVFFIFSILR